MIHYALSHWVEFVNAIGAWIAGCAHIYAAVHVTGHMRKLFMAIVSLAWLYSAAYWVLFFELVSVEVWSDFLRPFGIITWGLAWAIEPLAFVAYQKQRARGIVAEAESIQGLVNKRLRDE